MELKVWVEGIQRVVCGVTEATTCQDVVIALANAIGKTGRFSLIEKWRENERFLSPAEEPLRVLHKWGEYAADVQFILRYSDKDKKDSGSKTDKFHHDFSPHQEVRLSGRQSGHGIRKSLTFSGAHALSTVKPLTPHHRHTRSTGPGNSSLESLDERSSFTSHSSRSTASPYASLENRHLRHRNVPMQPVSPYGSLERRKTHVVKPSQYQSYSPVSPRTGSTPHSSLERRPKKTSPLAQQSGHMVANHPRTNHSGQVAIEEYDLDSHLSKADRSHVKVNGEGIHGQTSEKSGIGSSVEREDLIKLVKLQQEKLSVQESQVRVVDAEIRFLEQREQDFQQQIKIIQDEIQSLQNVDDKLEDEIQELDLVSWVDKVEIERQHEQMLRSELTLLRSELSNCESELLACRSKVHTLHEDLDKERQERTQIDQQKQKQEFQLMQEMSEVQRELNKRLIQQEETTQSVEKLQSELKELEDSIYDRKTQLNDLEKELKSTNLEVFMTVLSDVGSPPLSRHSPQRPGSARRMTQSPQLLKETVATTKNPHGLWV